MAEPAGEIQRAAREAVASGLRRHGPDAVGIVIKGLPICGLAAFAHFVLESSIPVTAIGATAVRMIIGAAHVFRKRSQPG
jgi:hypothetical protein